LVQEIVRGFDALGGSGASRLHPRRVGIPREAIALLAVDAKPKKRGGSHSIGKESKE